VKISHGEWRKLGIPITLTREAVVVRHSVLASVDRMSGRAGLNKVTEGTLVITLAGTAAGLALGSEVAAPIALAGGVYYVTELLFRPTRVY
jgi:hypothetical protein